MVILSSMITPKYFVKIKKNSKNTKFLCFFIRKINDYSFDTGFRKERKPK